MGMSTYVVGFKYSEEEAKKFHDVLKLCEELRVDPPKEVEEFFDSCDEEDEGEYALGEPVELEKISNIWASESSEGIEIKVSDIPKDIKIIRFVNSY